MSEVKSAREMSIEWEVLLGEAFADKSLDEMQAIICKLILSDRRAIIEKCKEAIAKKSNGYEAIGYGYMMSIGEASNVLDSVLSDLEKEE